MWVDLTISLILRLGGVPQLIYRRHPRKLEREDQNMIGELHGAVFEMAKALHRQVASDELFLLALTELDPSTPARRALEAAGITADRLRPLVRTEGDETAPAPDHLGYSPAYYSMLGRVDAFAACLGDGRVTPEHVLLALLWDADSQSSQLLHHLGVSAGAVVDRLGNLGVPVPASRPPEHEPVPFGEEVWFDRDQVEKVVDLLRLRLGPGTHWGFNYEGDRAYAVAEVGVDLAALVAEALPPAVEFLAIDHVLLGIPVGGEEEATTFYEGVLGLTRVPKPAHLAVNGGCWFESGDVHVHVGPDPDFRPARKAHPALRVRGLAALMERLRAAGVPVRESNGQVFTEDPFGNRVELLERGGTLLGPP
jgi:catechol 2,3-dioxygenase-like lactoylglutathione lyase family enzyme